MKAGTLPPSHSSIGHLHPKLSSSAELLNKIVHLSFQAVLNFMVIMNPDLDPDKKLENIIPS